MTIRNEATKLGQTRRVNSPKTRDEGQIEIENILQPFHSGCGLVCEDFDEIRASLVTGGFDGIIVEGLDAVLDAEVDLCAGESAIDSGGGLGGVAPEEI